MCSKKIYGRIIEIEKEAPIFRTFARDFVQVFVQVLCKISDLMLKLYVPHTQQKRPARFS